MADETEREDKDIGRDQWGYALCTGRRVGAYSGGAQCAMRGTIEREGKWYCMKHTPEMVALTAKLKEETASPAGKSALTIQRVRAAALLGAAAAFNANNLSNLSQEFFARADAMSEGYSMDAIDQWVRNEIRLYFDLLQDAADGTDEET